MHTGTISSKVSQKKYHVHDLVYFEAYDDINEVITREKRMKKWKRQWKIELIEKDNHNWNDLYDYIIKQIDSCFRRNDILDYRD